MKRIILLLITLTTLPNLNYASFPIDNNIISANNDPGFIGGITILVGAFMIYALIWTLIIFISIILLRFLIYKKSRL